MKYLATHSGQTISFVNRKAKQKHRFRFLQSAIWLHSDWIVMVQLHFYDYVAVIIIDS